MVGVSNFKMSAGANLSPDFLLSVNSLDVTANIKPRLMSLTMTDNRGFEADQLDIELDDADGKLVMPVRGAVVSVFLGWQGQALVSKGQFTVDEVEHHGTPDTMTIRARSVDFRGTFNSRREVSYHDTKLGDIVRQVADRNKLDVSLAQGLADIAVAHIDQTQESDAKFLTRLASLYGAVVAIKAGKLMFIRPGNGVTASGKPIPQLTITRADGDRHTFSIADRGAYTGVIASWLHTKDPKPKKVKLQRKPKVQNLRALQHPAAKKVTAKPVKAVEAKEGEYLVGSDENVFALTTVYSTKAAAMSAARAKWEKLQRGVAEFSLTLAKGRADLFPETPVRVTGFKSVIDAQAWTISKVTHNLGSSGYTTNLNFEVLLTNIDYQVEQEDN